MAEIEVNKHRGSKFEPLSPRTFVPADTPVVPDDISWHPVVRSAIFALPAGQQKFWGIPFELASSADERRWLWLSQVDRRIASVSIQTRFDYVALAHFCGASRVEGEVEPGGFVIDLGKQLATYVLVYADGQEHRIMIRRRFEINDVFIGWGQLAFNSRPHRAVEPRSWRGPHQDWEWGENQKGAELPMYSGVRSFLPRLRPVGNYWVFALRNPRPRAEVKALRLEATGEERIGVGGITLVRGHGNPLRHHRLITFLVDGGAGGGAPTVSVDLGSVARTVPITPTSHRDWMTAPVVGWGSPPPQTASTRSMVEVVASEAAMLSVAGVEVRPEELLQRRAIALPNQVRIEPLPPTDVLLTVEVRDENTDALLPSRVHFRTPEGRYLPPAGHRQEVNDRWFQDYGADLKLGEVQYAYVPGRFQIRLPRSRVFVEIAKGFEYKALRESVTVVGSSSQQPLVFHLDRTLDIRSEGWISADTHVHFLSPETAWLQAQAEDLNIVNLLASQWGDLFTNVGDYSGDLSGVSRNGSLVWVGTENRQHLLGHISLLGMRGQIPAPLSAAGPSESYLGDPTWTSLSDWAEHAHQREGLVIVPHFPNPFCEVVADIAVNRVDGLEIRDFWTGIETRAVCEWYRLLNCGYRIPIVGGTDKMSAAMPVGGVRTYAQIGDEPLNWEAWKQSVRSGRTYTSSGPILHLSVEGHSLGDQIRVKRGSGTLEVEASARCFAPLSRLEVIYNGATVAATENANEQNELRLRMRLPIRHSGWIAARCCSRYIAWHEWPVHFAAHTSPIYVVAEDRAPNPQDIVYLQTVLEGGLTWLKNLATQADDGTHSRIEAVFAEAMRLLEQRRANHHGS